jgi:beta-glucanase (GH16 family)
VPFYQNISMRALIIGTALALNLSFVHAGPVIVPGWGSPVFQDNFSGSAISTSVWEVANRANAANGEAQYYHPSQVSVSNDALHLRADIDPTYSHGKPYNSGLVRTWQEWSHGRFEVRAKLPTGQGFWPAIWLLPRHANWPSGGEIDIMEARGDLPYGVSSALHYGWDYSSRQYRSEWYEGGANFQADFHDYTVEWEVGTVRFYVDGVEHMRLYEPDVSIPSTPKSLILNLAVGGNYSGYPDASTPFPTNFDIDYVRVWQRPEPSPPPASLIVDAGFENSGGGMNAWEVFGNSINNVLSDYGTPLDGERSLKLFGQFNGQTSVSGAFQSVAIEGGSHIIAGAHALTRSEDSIADTGNRVEMKLEFYSQAGAAYGSQYFLGESLVTLADGNSPEDAWSYLQINELAPLAAVEARLAFVFIQPQTNDGGSVFIDSVTLFANAAGDFDGDGDIDGRDFLVWQLGGSPNPFSATDLAAWQTNYGTANLNKFSTAIPEPAGFTLMCLVALGAIIGRSTQACCLPTRISA